MSSQRTKHSNLASMRETSLSSQEALHCDNLLVPPHSEGDSSIYSTEPITLPPPPPTGLTETCGGSYCKANRDP